MSSFICSPRHFNSVEYALSMLLIGNEFNMPYAVRQRFPKLDGRTNGIDTIGNEVTRLFDEARKLSALCVSLQYKHHYEGKLDQEIAEQTALLLTERTELSPLTIEGLYKALACIQYQIEVGHLEGIRELTKDEVDAIFFMDEMRMGLAEHIASNTPNYTAAKWSF